MRRHGGMVVVAPIGTNPALGGSFSTVPIGTRSGFLMLFNSTNAGALKLNRSAMLYRLSPVATVYSRGTYDDVVGGIVVVTTDVVAAELDPSPIPRTWVETASIANVSVLHINH